MLRWIKNKTGQIAVLLALSFGLLTLLVAMVVNIGFLVAAKINLQNSVDMAAYAGAAQQARYLTEIGKWNYEMRRNYKAMVFDYLLTYSAEFRVNDSDPSKNEFKMYVNNSNPDGSLNIRTPWVCASLQGGSGKPGSTTDGRSKICEKLDAHTYQDAINKATEALIATSVSQMTICSINPGSSSCQALNFNVSNQLTGIANLDDASAFDSDTFLNYKDNDPLNYTLRLIAWMLHDYRHLQSRIRGVHFGDISMGSRSSNNLTGRWDLFKDKTNVVVFNNSPISVASKVINGFTSSEDTTTKLEANKANLLEDNGGLIKNPVNNAALSTFKNNLMTVIEKDAKLFHITPQNFSINSNIDMSGGCSGKCSEFTGPYLKLKQHDVNFTAYYTAVDVTTTGTVGKPKAGTPKPVGNFPVGVAKDNRLLTYYTVVGTAKVDRIPFNVFFGNEQNSNKEVVMVAVASARPFGSRIGPYVDDTCEDLYDGENHSACIKNGLDPLYPFKKNSSTLQAEIPNFSILTQPESRSLGVKLTVGQDEYNKATVVFPGWDDFSEFFGKTRTKNGRARNFKFPAPVDDNDSYKRDDGFRDTSSVGPPSNSTDFFDHDSTATHPQGNRDSVWAWDNNMAYQRPTTIIPPNERNNYEGYLKLAQSNNLSLYKFADLPKRKSGGGLIGENQYSIYVFKYPNPSSTNPNKWDIGQRTSTNMGYGNMMEYAFANAMAVNLFEIQRYIIPSKNGDSEYMNYLSSSNKNANIYGGDNNRGGIVNGQGNKPFEEVVTGMESTDTLKEQGGIGESYTSWRIGTRGYRVKLIKVKDLVADSCTSKYQNCLNSTYTLDDTGGESFTIDLSKIDY